MGQPKIEVSPVSIQLALISIRDERALLATETRSPFMPCSCRDERGSAISDASLRPLFEGHPIL